MRAWIHDGAPLLEVELGDNDLLAGEQVVEVGVKKLDVHGSKGLEIVLSVLVLWSHLAGEEVIVQLYHLGRYAKDPALLCDTQRTAGLAAGTGPRDHYYAGMLPAPEDLVGAFAVFTLLTCLAQVYEGNRIS